MKKSRYPYPKFVKTFGGRSFRLVKKGNKFEYYSDRGQWSIGFEIIEGVMFTKEHEYMPNMEGDELMEASEDEWKEANKGYVPKSTKVELPEHMW